MKPVIEPCDFGDKITHPAFMQISACRVNGGIMLYGSEFKHRSFISIRLHTSYEIRGLSRAWHHADKAVMELNLSEAQWATFISSLNAGMGSPATLEFMAGKDKIPPVELLEPRANTFRREYKETIANTVARLKKGIEDAKAAKVKKSIIADLEGALQGLISSAPYVESSFSEHMEDLVQEAKMAANAYAEHIVQQTGVKTLKGPEE